MRTSTVVFSGGGEAPRSKWMRAICVAGRVRAISCCCIPAYTPETGRICAIVPGMRRLPNNTETTCPTWGSIRRSLGMYQSTKMSVGSRISAIGVPAGSDWPTSARPVEMIPAIGANTRPWPKWRSASSSRPRSCLMNSSSDASCYRDVAARAADPRIAEYGREPRDSGRLENRVRIHSQEQIAAGKPGRRVYCCTAAAARAMADDHVHHAQCASSLRDRACIIGRAVIHDDDFDRPRGLSLQRRDRGREPGAAVERRYDHADRSVACRRSLASTAHAEESQRKQRERVARNVEYQHGEGEQEQIGSGEQLHHFEHVTSPCHRNWFAE